METARAHVWVTGMVQGVFFRVHTREEARRLGVSGWVRNLPDGRVEAVFEGTRDRVEAAVAWCRHGPPTADVQDLRVAWEPPSGSEGGFAISY